MYYYPANLVRWLITPHHQTYITVAAQLRASSQYVVATVTHNLYSLHFMLAIDPRQTLAASRISLIPSSNSLSTLNLCSSPVMHHSNNYNKPEYLPVAGSDVESSDASDYHELLVVRERRVKRLLYINCALALASFILFVSHWLTPVPLSMHKCAKLLSPACKKYTTLS